MRRLLCYIRFCHYCDIIFFLSWVTVFSYLHILSFCFLRVTGFKPNSNNYINCFVLFSIDFVFLACHGGKVFLLFLRQHVTTIPNHVSMRFNIPNILSINKWMVMIMAGIRLLCCVVVIFLISRYVKLVCLSLIDVVISSLNDNNF